MLNVSTVTIDGTEFEMWDATKLKSYSCMMRGKLEHEEHFIPKGPREAIAFGQALHKAVEVWTQKSAIEGKTEGEAVIAGMDAAIHEWRKELPQEYRDGLELSGDRRSEANLLRLFDGFRQRFPLSQYEKIIECEKTFALPLGTTPQGVKVAWCGKRDRVVKPHGAGVQYVDVKTSTFGLDAGFFDQFRLSGQMLGYAWAGQIELGLEFEAIVIQAVQVQAPLKTRSKSGADLCGSDTIDISEEMIERWAKNTLMRIDAIHTARAQNYYPYDFGELCRSYNRPCPMSKICQSPESMWPIVKEENYIQRVWSPFEEGEV